MNLKSSALTVEERIRILEVSRERAREEIELLRLRVKLIDMEIKTLTKDSEGQK